MWVLFAVLLVGCFLKTATAEEPPHRNVLLIAVDDLRPALSCYGDNTAITPNLDRLAKRGVVFHRAYCQQAVCSPSRLSLMTGRRPDTIRVWDLKTHFRDSDDDIITLPQHFKDHGYFTQSIGKIYHGSGKPSKDPPSWSVDPKYDSVRDPNLRYALKENLQGKGLKRASVEAADVSDEQYIDGIVCNSATKTLAELKNRKEPFFLAVGFRKPHLPFCAPMKYWDQYDRDKIPALMNPHHPIDAPEFATRSWGELEGYTDIPKDGELSANKIRELRHGYYACVSYVDAMVGRLLDELERLDIAKNTVVAFYGDHGFHLGEQGLWTKANNYELSTRVPLIISVPGQNQQQKDCHALVEFVDLYPTLADVCGLSLPKGVEGNSMRTLLENPSRTWKRGALSQFPRATKDNRHRGHGDIMGYAIRTDRYRYVRWQKWDSNQVVAQELYDHQSDPGETKNVIAQQEYTAESKRLAKMLDAGWKSLLPEIAKRKPTTASANQASPNVLFVCVDDMKDWVGCLGGYEGTVFTPNIDRLAKRGVLFTNAHCASPKCAPSRAAILTGLRPSTTGLYDNGHWWLPNLPSAVTIPMHFRNHGYHVVGAGKIFHHTAGNHPPNQWDAFRRLEFREDPWFRGVKLNYPWSKHEPYPAAFPFSGVKGLGHENDWGSLRISDQDYDDAITEDYVVRFLKKVAGTNESPSGRSSTPFFLACGFFRPHLPWYVPKKYFDMYELDDVVLPKTLANDLDDLPQPGLKFAKARRSDFETIVDARRWKHAVRAYLASITCVDDRIGRVLNALDESSHADNTIIVLWSDHGWHLGEKQHWHKSTLWEEATRVPLVISAPGVSSGVCNQPVSLLDLYPTITELADLKSKKKLDGVSLVPLLRDPNAKWDRPAVIEYKRGNAAVRSDRYRYIRYKDGSEELYDHEKDPLEWNNLADGSENAAIKKRLRKWIVKDWSDSAPTKSAFEFDHNTFTWESKKTGMITHGNEK